MRFAKRPALIALSAVAALALAGCEGVSTGIGTPANGANPGGSVAGVTPPANGTGTLPGPGTGLGGPTPAPVASSAEPQFISNVAPILLKDCATASCHGAPTAASGLPFIPASASASDLYNNVLTYSDKLVANTFDKTQAQVLTKIAAGHNAVAYSSTDISNISSWLDAEVTARAGQSTGPSVARKAEAAWSGCMVAAKATWDAQQVAVKWATKNTQEGRCQQCHINGQGFLATQDTERMFTLLTSTPMQTRSGNMVMELYFVPDLTDPANPKMIINTALMNRAGGGNDLHPQFTLTNDPAFAALQAFYTDAQTKQAAGQCAAPAFTP